MEPVWAVCDAGDEALFAAAGDSDLLNANEPASDTEDTYPVDREPMHIALSDSPPVAACSALSLSCFMATLRGADSSDAVVLRFPPGRSAAVECNGRLVGEAEDLCLTLRRDRSGAYTCTDCVRTDATLQLELCVDLGRWVYGRLEKPSSEAEAGWTLHLTSPAPAVAVTISDDPAPAAAPAAHALEVCLVGICAARPVCMIAHAPLPARRRRSLVGATAGRSLAMICEDGGVKAAPAEALDLVTGGNSSRGDKGRNGAVGSLSFLALAGEGDAYSLQAWADAGGAAAAGQDGVGHGSTLTWFNAGLRIGVGVGLGVCLGLGLGVGILMRTYQAARSGIAARVFK